MTVTHPELVLRLEQSGVDPASPYVREAATVADLPAHAAWIAASPALMPALVFTWRALDGTTVEQVNPMVPVTNRAGETSKYLWPAGQGSILNVLESKPAATTVVIVEGTKQCLAAMRYAHPDWQIIGLGGCSSWTTDGVADPTLASLVNGKPVVMVFDADWQSNRSVFDAAKKLGETATTFGASSVAWGLVPGRGTTGLDDVIGGLDEGLRGEVLARIVNNALPKMGRAPRATKGDGSTPFWNGKAALVEKIAMDIMLHRSLAIDASGEVCVYRDGVYRRDSKEIRGEVVDRLQDHYTRSSTGNTTDVLYKMCSDHGLLIVDPTEPLLNVKNGMLDLRDGKLHPHDPKYMSSQQIPVEWHPDAKCPVYDKWVVSMTDDVPDLEESVSLMLDPTRSPTKAPFLYGPSRSGKSTYLRLIQSVAGRENCSSVSLAQLTEDKFSAAQLFGKILNVSADLSAQHLNDMATFKQITGQDQILAQHKYGQPFGFTNQALLLFSANVPPAVSETSSAYLERIKPLVFPNSFAGHEDPSIEEAMLGELPGILVRLVNAYQTWVKRGWYRDTRPDVADDFAVHADRVRAWMREECEVPASGGTPGRQLFYAYRVWAEDNTSGGLKLGAFMAKLLSAGIEEFTVSTTRARHFRLRLRQGGFNLGAPRQRGSSTEAPTPQPTTSSDPETAADDREVSSSALIVSSTVGTHSETEVSARKGKERRRPEPLTMQLGLTGAVAVDFETPDAVLVYADPNRYFGPFPRALGWDDGQQRGTTSDPDVMRQVLTEAPSLIVHDGWRYDLPLAAFHLGLDAEELIAKSDDLIILSRLNRPPRDREARLDQYGLDHLADVHLGEHKSDVLAKLKRKHKGYDKIPVDDPDYLAYLAKDADITRRLYEEAKDLTTSVYYQSERQVAIIAARLTLTGLRVDTDLLADRIAAQDAREKAIIDRLVELGFPRTADPGATKVGKALLASLANGVPMKTTPGGAISTAREVLQDLVLPAGHPLAEPVELLISLSEERPFANTVADNLNQGRVHPEHLISGVNGRWSTKRPNVMGVGKRSEDLLRDRELILPEEGEIFIQADLKGIDNRSVAGLSGDEAYVALLQPGIEINAELARMFYGEDVDYAVVKPKIKAIGHGINFGRGARKIAQDNDLDLAEVKEIWAGYFRAFPDLARWQKDIRKRAEAGESLPNGFGRFVRTTPGNEYTEAPARQTASCTRDLAMTGLLRLGDDLRYVRLFVHDELVLSVPEEIADEVLERVVTAMSFDWTSPSGLVIPIIAEPSKARGKNWAEVYSGE